MAHSITDTCKMKREILNFTRSFFDEWWNVKTSEFRRGDENRPKPRILASTRLNGTARPGSLSEGAGSPKGVTEGVYYDEW